MYNTYITTICVIYIICLYNKQNIIESMHNKYNVLYIKGSYI